jgi:carbonic anhydrase
MWKSLRLAVVAAVVAALCVWAQQAMAHLVVAVPVLPVGDVIVLGHLISAAQSPSLSELVAQAERRHPLSLLSAVMAETALKRHLVRYLQAAAADLVKAAN